MVMNNVKNVNDKSNLDILRIKSMQSSWEHGRQVVRLVQQG